jgi:hypothetical protein
MAVQTIYILTAAAVTPNWFGRTQLNGTAPSQTNTAYGWTPAKIALTTPYYQGRLGASSNATVAQAASWNASTSGPTKGTGATATTAGDSYIAGPFLGAFAAGTWTANWQMRASTAGAIGHINMRVWRSVNADGSAATQILANTVGATITLSTTVAGNSVITWSPGALTLNNEYLFFQLEWQETTVGSSNTNTVAFLAGQTFVTTTDYVPVVVGTLGLTQDAQTIAAAGWSTAVGTLVKTAVSDALVATGKVDVRGTLSFAETADGLSAAGTVAAASGGPSTNVAFSGNGGVAIASSVVNSSFPASNANSGSRDSTKNGGWGNGGGWNDGTQNIWPDTFDIAFNATYSIKEIDVITLKDQYAVPGLPTLTDTFSSYGIIDFLVQYWDGSTYQTIATVTANNNVWRQFLFTPISTNRIRLSISNAGQGYSRLVEVEAWTQEDTGGVINASLTRTEDADTISAFALNTTPAPILYLVTSYTPPYDRNDYDGGVGMVFQPGHTETYNRIGLQKHNGNTGAHIGYLYNYNTKALLASVSIDLTAGTVGNFYYGIIPPITVNNTTQYAVMTDVVNLGQLWGEHGPTVLTNGTYAVYAACDVARTSWGVNGSGEQFAGVDLAFVPDAIGVLSIAQADQTISAAGTVAGVGGGDALATLAITQAPNTLGAVAQAYFPVISGGLGDYAPGTVLMVHADGANGSIGFTDNSATRKTMLARGAAQVAVTLPQFGTGSADFTGNAASAVVSNNATDFNFGASPFTIEAWIYSTSSGSGPIVTQWSSTNANLGWELLLAAGRLRFLYSTTGTDGQVVQGNFTPTLNTWYHVAVDCDAGGTIRAYVDGAVVVTVTRAAPLYASTRFGMIGGVDDASPALAYPGRIDEVMVRKGYASYGGAFTRPSVPYTPVLTETADTISAAGTVAFPLSTATLNLTQASQGISAAGAVLVGGTLNLPQAPETIVAAGGPRVGGSLGITQASQTIAAGAKVDLVGSLNIVEAADTLAASGTLPVASPVVLLMHCDGTSGATTFVDSSSSAHVLTATNVQVNTVNPKFGTGDAYFLPGNPGAAIDAGSSSDFWFDDKPFTIEAWCWANSTAGGDGYAPILATWGAALANLGIFFNVFPAIQFFYSTGGTDYTYVDSGVALPIGAWVHVAVDRDASGMVRLYLNGAVIGSASVPVSFYHSTFPLQIGNDNTASREFPGALDEVRVIKGAAMYGGTFTPQPTPYPSPGAPTYFNPDTTYTTNITLQNNNLTAVRLVGGGTYDNAYTTTTQGGAKVYAEVHIDTMQDAARNALGIGLNTGPTHNSWVGDNPNSFGWWNDGSVYNNSTVVSSTAPTYLSGHWLGIAVDRTAKTVQFRNITTSSAWCAPISIATYGAKDVSVVVTCQSPNQSFTGNFDGTFIGTPPDASYTRWNGSSAAAPLFIGGTLAVTQASQTLAATAGPIAGATLTRTQADQTIAAQGKVDIRGTLGILQASHTLASIAGPIAGAALGLPQASQTLAGQGKVDVKGTLGLPQAAQTISAGATVLTGSSATLTLTQANQTLLAAGTVPLAVVGSLGITQAPQTIVGAAGPIVGAALARTQADQTISAQGKVDVGATLSLTQAPETLVSGVNVTISGALVLTEAMDTISSVGRVDLRGSLNIVETADTIAAGGWTTARATLAVTEALDTIAAGAVVDIRATLARTQADQTIAAQGKMTIAASLGLGETPDTISAAGKITVNGTLVRTQADHAILATGGPRVGGALSLTEFPDTVLGTVQVGTVQTRVIVMA